MFLVNVRRCASSLRMPTLTALRVNRDTHFPVNEHRATGRLPARA